MMEINIKYIIRVLSEWKIDENKSFFPLKISLSLFLFRWVSCICIHTSVLFTVQDILLNKYSPILKIFAMQILNDISHVYYKKGQKGKIYIKLST